MPDPVTIAQTCRAEPIPEYDGWRFHLDDLNASIDGWGGKTEAEARAELTEHVKAMMGVATDAEIVTAWVQFRAVRDRWLAQTDFVGGYLTTPQTFAYLPQAVRDAIDAHADEWAAWRQALRDLPAADGFDPLALLAVVPHSTTDSPWPQPWPQPPAGPVIYLT